MSLPCLKFFICFPSPSGKKKKKAKSNLVSMLHKVLCDLVLIYHIGLFYFVPTFLPWPSTSHLALEAQTLRVPWTGCAHLTSDTHPCYSIQLQSPHLPPTPPLPLSVSLLALLILCSLEYSRSPLGACCKCKLHLHTNLSML